MSTRRLNSAALILAAVVLVPAWARAMPRFAVQQGAACSLCHVNPTGAGARTGYGRAAFARQTLSMNIRFGDETAPAVDPTLGDWLAFGTDIRASYQHTLPRAVVPEDRELDETGTFFLMQGDLYVNAQLGPYFSFYYDQGTYGSQEIYARAGTDLISVKAGKFMPAYGWRLIDHSAFIREPIGFGPRAKDTGVSVVLDHQNLTVEAGAFNGAGSETPLDTELKRAYAARAEGRVKLAGLNLHLGASGYTNESGEGDSLIFTRRLGAFAGVGLGRLAWLFEIDQTKDRSSGGKRRGYVVYNELSLILLRGLQIAGTYEFQDPRMNVAEDALHRAGLSINFFPWPFAEIEIVGRDTIADPKNPRAGMLEGIIVIHAYL